MKQALAVDIGGTKLRAALVAADGTVLHRQLRQTPASEGAEAVVTAVVDACHAVLQASAENERLTLGLCAAGPLDPKSGVMLGTPTIKGFDNFPLRQRVADQLDLPVVLESDGPAAALGEWHFGAGRGASDVVYVTISTGIGGGIIAGDRLVRGRKGMAGHVGHLPVKPGGATCFCGQAGHWEAEASGSALQRKARDNGFSSLEDLFGQAKAGEARACAALAAAADDLALGFVSIIHMLSPERIVVGGGVSNAFGLLGPLLQNRLDALLLPAFRGVELRKAELGDDSGILGAALLAMREDLRA